MIQLFYFIFLIVEKLKFSGRINYSKKKCDNLIYGLICGSSYCEHGATFKISLLLNCCVIHDESENGKMLYVVTAANDIRKVVCYAQLVNFDFHWYIQPFSSMLFGVYTGLAYITWLMLHVGFTHLVSSLTINTKWFNIGHLVPKFHENRLLFCVGIYIWGCLMRGGMWLWDFPHTNCSCCHWNGLHQSACPAWLIVWNFKGGWGEKFLSPW